MDRVNRIISNPKYLELLGYNEEEEQDRVYCKHGMEHFLDVSRIAYILSLEEKLNFKKELIYSIGLLHDIGKFMQYKHKIPHEKASAELAVELLQDAGFDEEEIKIITDAILSHRKQPSENNRLSYIIYKADKLSRKCFCCPVETTCNWAEDKKNRAICL